MGAAIGSRENVDDDVNDKVTNWISEITRLAEFALTQPGPKRPIRHTRSDKNNKTLMYVLLENPAASKAYLNH